MKQMNGEYMQWLPQGGVTSSRGWSASGVACAIKSSNSDKKDLGLIYTEFPAEAAGVFTENVFTAAPVLVTRERLKNRVHAVVVNSGNANACVGERGIADARRMTGLAAGRLGVPGDSVLVGSTGVIGQTLPMDNIEEGITLAAEKLSEEGGGDAAESILTTDTAAKEAACRVQGEEGAYTIGGMAKGAGMICPNLATMLAFLTTDVEIDRELLQVALRRAADRSFNLISIDGDTSTNDTLLVMANGASGVKIKGEGPAFDRFCAALEEVCRDLAYRIVDDGEGATKVVALKVKGAPDEESAGVLAKSVLNSLLVKTAFFGEDANWGRIFMALGNAGVKFDPEKVDLYLGDVQVAASGQGLDFSEEEAARVLQCREVPVTVDLNQGDAELLSWGNDLSYEYVTINGSYRT